MFINWFLFSLVFWSNKYLVQEEERGRDGGRERGRKGWGETERGKQEREGKRDCDEQVHVVKERRCLEERMADRQKEIEKEA